ncbi:MAG: TerC family protein [Castellaniella sp.]
MEWVLEPSAWAGLLTLVVLEIVLGMDNLVFIAILVDKLPPARRDRARVIGLSLALLMRLGLLSIMSWLIQLTAPWLQLGPFTFSGRDAILIVGGFFLLLKGTLELHDRVEGHVVQASGARLHAGFAIIVTQIVVLDAVFSLDAVITAVGMVDHLSIMMLAVTIAVGLMLLASGPLTRFVGGHPTVVILCLGFLLTIGFSLVAEGFGFAVPKGYLYSAIAFSVLIESVNQIAGRHRRLLEARSPLRERTAAAIMRMLGKPDPAHPGMAPDMFPPLQDSHPVFEAEERYMVSGVLTLGERAIESVMTPRTEVSWVDLEAPAHALLEKIRSTPHSFFPVCRGSLDDVVGIGRAKEMISDLITEGRIRLSRLRPPVFMQEGMPVLELIKALKRSKGLQVLITDEFGAVEGLVTPIDVLEAIAGEFPDEDELPDIIPVGPSLWEVDGAADLHHLEQLLDTHALVDDDAPFSTLAGYLLQRFDSLPEAGDVCELIEGNTRLRFTVTALEGRRIASVRVERFQLPDAMSLD